MISKYRNFYIVYCIGSGFAALMVVLNSEINVINKLISISLDNAEYNLSFFLMYIFALGLSVFGIICGLKIANNSHVSKKYLRWYLIPQIPLISIPSFVYYFKLGLDFTIYLVVDPYLANILDARANFAIGSFFNLNYDAQLTRQSIYVGVNLIAVLLLISLLDPVSIYSKKRIKKLSRNKRVN
jgi:hypothetical protein